MKLSERIQIMLEAALFEDGYITIEAAELWEWQEKVEKLEAENERLREKKICCPYCARKYFLTNEGHKLVESLRDKEESGVAAKDSPE